ncbi:MAG: uracil-DNA glycosylase family protein, partial [Fervidobacterium sp.]
IGENYGEHEHFKVLIASLDRGKGKEDLEGRLKEIEEVCIERKELNPHMKGTLDALKIIFSDVKVNEDVELFKHFAMINTAKCCVGDSMAQAPWKFFDNCKEYTKGEIDILQPDIIITQGRCAAEVFELLYPELKNKDEWYERKGEINIGDNHKALVICSVHPSARGKWKNIWQGFIKNRLPEIIKDRKRK